MGTLICTMVIFSIRIFCTLEKYANQCLLSRLALIQDNVLVTDQLMLKAVLYIRLFLKTQLLIHALTPMTKTINLKLYFVIVHLLVEIVDNAPGQVLLHTKPMPPIWSLYLAK